MRTPSLSVVAAIAVLAAPALVAQQQPAPPLEIRIGETLNHALALSDDSLQDGSRYKLFELRGRANDSITVMMSSQDFNTHVILSDSNDNVLNNDANGGDGCNSHLSFVLPVSGRYHVFANGESRAEIGRFQLEVRRGIHPPASRSPCRGFVNPEGILAVGDSTTGTIEAADRQLADTSYFEVWTLYQTAGKTFTVDLVSAEFDARVILVRGFDEVLGVNDDSGPGCNARLGATANDVRPLRVVVIARPARRTGRYTLRVSEGERPMMDRDTCDPPGTGGTLDGA